MKLIKKVGGVLCKGVIGSFFNCVSFKYYMKYTIWYYRKCGVRIETPITYIHPSVYFDSHNYSLISISKNVTISRNVTFLVHDYSIANALNHMELYVNEGVPHFEKSIEIGENCFVGVNAILLPGTKIGTNCIIGAGSVVKGIFPENSIIVGNPAKVIANTEEWAIRKWKIKDWSTE